MVDKETIHRLVDELPEGELLAAQRFLEYLHARWNDPVRRVFEEAPDVDEPLTLEEEESIEESRRQVARGEGLSLETVIEQLRRAG